VSATEGHSLRDTFAGEAMVAVLRAGVGAAALSFDEIADYAYAMADAMLEARMRLPMQRHSWPVLPSKTEFGTLP